MMTMMAKKANQGMLREKQGVMMMEREKRRRAKRWCSGERQSSLPSFFLFLLFTFSFSRRAYEEIRRYFVEQALPRGEGLMVKTLGRGSSYEPDKRSDKW